MEGYDGAVVYQRSGFLAPDIIRAGLGATQQPRVECFKAPLIVPILGLLRAATSDAGEICPTQTPSLPIPIATSRPVYLCEQTPCFIPHSILVLHFNPVPPSVPSIYLYKMESKCTHAVERRKRQIPPAQGLRCRAMSAYMAAAKYHS